MNKVIYRLPRHTKDKKSNRKIILNKLEKYYAKAGKDFHFSGGNLSKEELAKTGLVKKEKDKFAVFDSDFLDSYKRIRRGAQIITLKDIGPIIVNAGITKNSKIIDAGSGSGGLACYLAMIASQVDSFDVKDERLEIAKENAKSLKIDNISFEKKDVYSDSDFNESDYDCFTLDVPEPWRAIKTAKKVLKIGGYLVVYTPNTGQAQEFAKALPENLKLLKSIEIIEREWTFTDKVSRPVTKDFGHTAFLLFVRKLF